MVRTVKKLSPDGSFDKTTALTSDDSPGNLTSADTSLLDPKTSCLLLNSEFKTRRVTASKLEKVLYIPFKVLDHGFVRVVDYMGDDSSIVQSARVSYGKGTKKVSTDSGLIKYLMRHWHSTPFEMCEIKYHVKLPIFIARQWIRHRLSLIHI